MSNMTQAMGREFKGKQHIQYLTPEEWAEHMKKFAKVDKNVKTT